MNNHRIIKLIAVAFLATSTSTLRAQNGQLPVVTTAVPMLRISADARSGGMGDASLAVAPDVNSVFTNLSKIPLDRKSVG